MIFGNSELDMTRTTRIIIINIVVLIVAFPMMTADDGETCSPKQAKQFGENAIVWKFVWVLVPGGLSIISLALAAVVAWFSTFVYWRQLAALEKLAKQMMDMAMSASLPEIMLKKAAAKYGAKNVSTLSASKLTTSGTNSSALAKSNTSAVPLPSKSNMSVTNWKTAKSATTANHPIATASTTSAVKVVLAISVISSMLAVGDGAPIRPIEEQEQTDFFESNGVSIQVSSIHIELSNFTCLRIAIVIVAAMVVWFVWAVVKTQVSAKSKK